MVFLSAMTGVSSYFFHPGHMSRAHQERGVALAYYSCAPLAWITPLLVLAELILWPMNRVEHSWWLVNTFVSFYSVAVLLAAFAPIVWWWTTLRLLLAATGSWPRAVIAAIVLPLIWMVLAAGIFLGLEFVLNYGALVLRGAR